MPLPAPIALAFIIFHQRDMGSTGKLAEAASSTAKRLLRAGAMKCHGRYKEEYRKSEAIAVLTCTHSAA